MQRLVHRVFLLLPFLLVVACTDPPSKEMNQAKGAIDAARAAGAERFAAEEFNAAVDDLKRYDEAVAAGDYRQALSLALDSLERAQNAAKLAVDGRAKARGDAEASLAQIATLLERAEARLKNPEVARLPRRALRDPEAAVGAAHKALQEARAAFEKDDYEAVTKGLEDVVARLQAALEQIDVTVAGAGAKRTR